MDILKSYSGKVCISSVYVREENFKDYRFTVANAVMNLGYKAVRNPEDAGSTQSSFEDILREDDPIFVLLVGDVDSDTVKKECNLAISLGLNIIAFLKTKNNNISDNTKKIMKEISEKVYDVDCSCFESCETLYNAVTNRILSYQERKLKYRADINRNKNLVYDTGSQMIQNSKRRIILSQDTSSLILGPRKGNSVERKFYDILLDWIKSTTPEMEFTHIFNAQSTYKSLKSKEYDSQKAKNNLRKLLSSGMQGKLSFREISAKNSISHLISDNDLLVSFSIENSRYNIFLPHFITAKDKIESIIMESQSVGKYVIESDLLKAYERK